jgi:hypothetical protein
LIYFTDFIFTNFYDEITSSSVFEYIKKCFVDKIHKNDAGVTTLVYTIEGKFT